MDGFDAFGKHMVHSLQSIARRIAAYGMAHLIFLTSTPATVAQGSGTWVGISVLRDALVALGHRVSLISDSRMSAKSILSRIRFNIGIRSRLKQMAADVLVGFDLDGVFAPPDSLFHVASIKGVLADEAHHERGRSRIGLALLGHFEARHARRSDRIITTSGYSAERIVKFYGVMSSKVSVVPELIDLAHWQRALDAAPIVEGPPRILCVAHLYPRKGVDTLIRAFARLRGRAVLRIAGIGPERQTLEQLTHELGIEDHVQFRGHLPFEELIAEYRNAAIFALPSTQEGFGIVFLEAMASSLPVVAARAAAVPEVVADGVTALLVDPDNAEQLAENLRSLLDDPARRVEMGSAGRARVDRYDAPIVGRQFLEAIGI
jgi:glycosyltransferase involved in cell wall biosynthesis